MLERERHHLIRKLVEDRSVVAVADLVELLGASEATIRRDIGAMADRGELRRVRGGAEALRPRHQPQLGAAHFSAEEPVALAEKQAIAKAAAAMLEDGDSVVINGGTTTYRLAGFLAERRLDVLTNSFPLAASLMRSPKLRVTIPGGTIYPQQNIVLSPFGHDMMKHFCGRLLFTGCHGLNGFGLMETDPLIAQSLMSLLGCAETLVVLADSRKLRQRSSMIVAPLSRITTVITDRGATAEELDMLRAAGVETIVVDPEPLQAQAGGLQDVA
ncbi:MULTISPECIES: DeoR/GlpR family DNA-binding transcription regulator [Acidocella]|uniref:DeoR/GlpR family DNA-binding transcription regulator n=1 Tax=Acidocella TaxID=50709 RepID=UPI00028D243B|nr:MULTISPECIES: DeoR/GlpR family DNA-binding transcription regulator [Acidocella]EKM98561.1 transcriptional regulator [Acidocella sp. MX-AZ02]WBO59065.1 DeoR/GlpR family DNA-binding transcription regulator [Acidocella sp. MX-AZ03]